MLDTGICSTFFMLPSFSVYLNIPYQYPYVSNMGVKNTDFKKDKELEQCRKVLLLQSLIVILKTTNTEC